MNDFYAVQLQAQKIQEETGLTLDQILALPTDEYARLTNRPTTGQIASQTLDPGPGQQAPEPAQSAPQAPAPEPQGIDVASLDMATYAQLRGQFGVGGRKEGRGIFDSVGSRSDEYTAAVRAQSGRTGWNNANVQQAPRIERAYVPEEAPPVYRSAAERFSTPGNFYGS